MIYINVPFASGSCEKNIGCAYNQFMEILAMTMIGAVL